MELTFENILSHINTIYVLRTREGFVQATRDEPGPDQGCLRLKVRKGRILVGWEEAGRMGGMGRREIGTGT